MHFNTKLIGWVVVIVVVVFAGYVLFVKAPAPATTPDGTATTQTVGGDLLALLGKLQNVNFSSDLFSDPNFLGLTDFAIPLPTPVTGRSNPFDKIGVDAGPVTSGGR